MTEPVSLHVEQHSSGAEPVLLLHGLSAISSTWNSTVEHLTGGHRAGGYEVWTVDFRGHGRSGRAPGTYLIDGYVQDARSVLDTIGRPTWIVGHSLGGVTAAAVAAGGTHQVTGVFLEDPPMFLNQPGVWETAPFAQLFTLIRDAVRRLQDAGAPLDAFVDMVGNALTPSGAIAKDELTSDTVAQSALALSLFDTGCFDTAIDNTVFAGYDPFGPIPCPVTIVQADPTLGPAFLPGDDTRVTTNSPHANVVVYEGVGHRIHGDRRFVDRFHTDLDSFLTQG